MNPRLSWKQIKQEPVSKGCAKAVFVLLLGVALPFYGAFAFYLLWNWFVADLLHARISYWQAAGVFLLFAVVSMVFSHDLEKEDRWVNTRIVIEACVPEAKKEAVATAIKESQERMTFVGADVRRLIRCTVLILCGLVIHIFLA